MRNTEKIFNVVTWVLNVLWSVASAIVFFVFENADRYLYLASALCFVMIVLNVIHFTDGKAKTAARLVYAAFFAFYTVYASVRFSFWWAGAGFGLAMLYFRQSKMSLRVAIDVAALALSEGLSLFLTENITTQEVLKTIGIGLLIEVIWHLFLALAEQYEKETNKVGTSVKNLCLDALHEKKLREQIAQTNALSVQNARLEERERISRDIHNQVGHTLSAATVTLEAAGMLVEAEPERAEQKINQANDRILEAISSIRKAVRTLDSDNDMVLLSDYSASLQELLKNFAMDTEISVRNNLAEYTECDDKISIDCAAFLSGALSEFLTNGVKHGGATLFVVFMSRGNGKLKMTVQDNGCGFGDMSEADIAEKLHNGFGLRKIIDGAKCLGGDCRISGNDGFEVVLTVSSQVQ